MASRTQIVNIALMRIGVSQTIANLDTENSREALSARLLFDDEVRFVLRDFPWPFATAYATLGLVDGAADDPANRDWTFAYRYPSDCLFVRRIVTENGRNDTAPPPYRIGRDTQGKLLYTNEEDAQIEYTFDVTDCDEFDSLFVSALAWKLAASLAPSLSRINKMAEQAMQMYAVDLSIAQARALNEQQQEQPAESEFISART